MSTEAQIAANRANAQQSTGPTSPEGKAVSARNALKTGIDAQSLIMPGEDPAAFETLRAEYYAAHRPVTPEARALVDTLVRNEWFLRRFDRIEAQLWADQAGRLEEPRHQPFLAARSYAAIDKQLARLQTRMNAAQRNFQRALKDLLALEAKQNKEVVTLAPAEIEVAERTQSSPEPAPKPAPETPPERTQFPSERAPEQPLENSPERTQSPSPITKLTPGRYAYHPNFPPSVKFR